MKNINFNPYIYSFIPIILINLLVLIYNNKFNEINIIILITTIITYIFTILVCNWEHNKHPFKFIKKK